MKMSLLFVVALLYIVLRTCSSIHNSINSSMVSNQSSFHSFVPLISVSLNVDPKNYIGRLIQSFDFPVHRLILQIGPSLLLLLVRIYSSIVCRK